MLFAILLTAGACTSPRPAGEAPVFYPPSPELPRVQYLTSFTGRKDIEEQSGFNRFVVGEKANVAVDKPYGVAIWNGRIYVCDTNASVFVFDLKEKQFGTLIGAYGAGSLRQPVNISVDRDGNKYITDPARGQVVVFGKDDEFTRAYGTPGSWRPVDAVPFGENLYVVDTEAGLVKVFDLVSGEQVRSIGDKGEPSERLGRPTNLAFDAEGYLYVTDLARFQVVKFDRDGHFRATFGSPGDSAGHFARPKGIAVDREGHLHAVDANYNNVQLFNAEGRILMAYGESGDKPGQFLLPAKVTLDYDNVKLFEQYAAPGFRIEYLILATSQFGKRRVNVFAYGQQSGKKYPSDDELLKGLEERRRQELEKEKARETVDPKGESKEPGKDGKSPAPVVKES